MRDQHYKNKTIRIADETWERLKEERRKSNKSWNMFSVLILKLLKKYGHSKN